MNVSTTSTGSHLTQDLRVRIIDAFNLVSEVGKADYNTSMRRDFLRLIMCWLEDNDRKSRENGHEKGCADTDIHEFLKELRRKKEAAREVHLTSAEFVEAYSALQEIRIIDEFLPKKLGAKALDGEIETIVAKLGAKKLKDLPACLNALEARFPGQIDKKIAGVLVRKALG